MKTQLTYLSSFNHRLAGRSGTKRATMAVAHRMLTVFYPMLTKREPYCDLVTTYLDERHKTA